MIPFNRAYITGKELLYASQAHSDGHLAANGRFTRYCSAWLEQRMGSKRALLTTSCTAALEISAILADLQPGDEVIMPSYTFVSTANAFKMRGAVPVFVDIRPDTLNIDEQQIEAAITPRSRAIVPVHYAGVACEMDVITEIARRHGLLVIEDAAQAILADYQDRAAGSIGDMAAVSFHETKNITSGEGGALLINNPRFLERAEIVRENGTNRSQFNQGKVDKYTWLDIGSSYAPSELSAAFLWAQMEHADSITAKRLALWETYYHRFLVLEEKGLARRPSIPAHCRHNAHMFYLLLPDHSRRDRFINFLGLSGIESVFHYVPLHSSPMGWRYGRAASALRNTDELASRLARLPLWVGMEEKQDEVVNAVIEAAQSV